MHNTQRMSCLLGVGDIRHPQLSAQFLLKKSLEGGSVTGIAKSGIGKYVLAQFEVQVSQVIEGLVAW